MPLHYMRFCYQVHCRMYTSLSLLYHKTTKKNKKKKRQKNKENQREKKHVKKIPTKPNTCVSKGLARKAASDQHPKKQGKKTTKKRRKPKGKKNRKKNPDEAKRLRFKRVGPKNAENPETKKKQEKKQKQNQNDLKVFWTIFGALPAAASCPAGKTTPPSKPSRAK